jgi:hypothetical protein
LLTASDIAECTVRDGKMAPAAHDRTVCEGSHKQLSTKQSNGTAYLTSNTEAR